jgi:hypothetical protein
MKYVNDEIEIVEEHPPSLTFTLAPVWLQSDASEPRFDFLDDRSNLALGIPRSDNEEIGDPEERRDIENDDVGGFLGRGGLGRLQRSRFRVAQPVDLSWNLLAIILSDDDRNIHDRLSLA